MSHVARELPADIVSLIDGQVTGLHSPFRGAGSSGAPLFVPLRERIRPPATFASIVAGSSIVTGMLLRGEIGFAIALIGPLLALASIAPASRNTSRSAGWWVSHDFIATRHPDGFTWWTSTLGLQAIEIGRYSVTFRRGRGERTEVVPIDLRTPVKRLARSMRAQLQGISVWATAPD